MAFCEFVLLAACYACVATVSGLEGPFWRLQLSAFGRDAGRVAVFLNRVSGSLRAVFCNRVRGSLRTVFWIF